MCWPNTSFPTHRGDGLGGAAFSYMQPLDVTVTHARLGSAVWPLAESPGEHPCAAEVTPLHIGAASALIIKDWRQRRSLFSQSRRVTISSQSRCYRQDISKEYAHVPTYTHMHIHTFTLSLWGRLCWDHNTLSGSHTTAKLYFSLMPLRKGLDPGDSDTQDSKLGRALQCHHIKKTCLFQEDKEIEGRRKRGRQRMRWLDGISDSMDMGLSKSWKMVKDREDWPATVYVVTESQTWFSDWKTVSMRGTWWVSQFLTLPPEVKCITSLNHIMWPRWTSKAVRKCSLRVKKGGKLEILDTKHWCLWYLPINDSEIQVH